MTEEEKIGLDITEKEYRDLPCPSYSLLSDYAKVGSAALSGIRNDISDLDGIIVGKIVDSVITEGVMPELCVIDKKPTGKAKEIINFIVRNFEYLKNKKEVFHEDNKFFIEKICDALNYNKNFETRLKALKNYESYLNVLLFNDDKIIISSYLYSKTTKLIQNIKTKYPFVTDPQKFNLKLLPQVKLLGEFNDIKIKGMLDFVLIDNINKKIIPYDLKTGSYKSSDFKKNGFVGWNYYLQAALYYKLLKDELSNHKIYKEYELQDFNFMYCSRFENNPIIFKVTKAKMNEALNGFNFDGKNYPGLVDLIESYKKEIEIQDDKLKT